MGKVGSNTVFSRPLLLQGGGQKMINVGYNTKIGQHSVLGCWLSYGQSHFNPRISIGNNCSIGEYCHISAINSIIIGDGLLTGRFVYIGDNTHGGLTWNESVIQPSKRELQSKGGIRVGQNVWIGDKVTILGGVSIGDNVIIGANSVVTHSIPSNCIAVGAPARIIKELKKT